MIDQLFMDLKVKYPEIEEGKMMSAKAITINGKVFCFEYKNQMVFKLGKDYELPEGISFEYLNPFKNKGPMLAWYVIDHSYHNHFFTLASIAYTKLK